MERKALQLTLEQLVRLSFPIHSNAVFILCWYKLLIDASASRSTKKRWRWLNMPYFRGLPFVIKSARSKSASFRSIDLDKFSLSEKVNLADSKVFQTSELIQAT